MVGVDIDQEKCIGCGLCEELSPDFFEVVDGKARCKCADMPKESLDQIDLAMENCPVQAIRRVDK